MLAVSILVGCDHSPIAGQATASTDDSHVSEGPGPEGGSPSPAPGAPSGSSEAASSGDSLPSQESPSAGWPNEPPDMMTVVDAGMDEYPPLQVTNQPDGGSYVAIVEDATAPTGSNQVYRETFWRGMSGGVGPSIQQQLFGGRYSTVFIGTYWKVSEDFENHPSNINKLLYTGKSDPGSAVSIHYFGATELDLQPVPEAGLASWAAGRIRHNGRAPRKIVGGRWYRLELLLEKKTGAYWRARLWVDGKLYIDSDDGGVAADNGNPHAPLVLTESGYDYAEIASIWGGMGSKKTKDDYMWWDHFYVSVR